MRQVIELDRDRDPGDLAEEPRDRLAGVEQPEGPRFPQRANVDREATEEAARPRRGGADWLLLEGWL